MGMMDSFNSFVDTMLTEQSNFENMQNEVEKKEDDVLSALKDLENRENAVISSIKSEIVQSNDEGMEEIFSKTSESLYHTMVSANEKIAKAVKGMTFIHDFEKHFTVSVFGKVKAGKSYLGNLILGRFQQENGIESSYDKLTDRTVHVYDKGKLYEQKKLTTEIEQKECNGEEFYVNENEATSTIQWVNIGGMCWFDTPGIGSVTVENEELAKEYVKNSDLVIFACNSDAAGTRKEFEELRQLHDMGKPILLLLTQSDTYEYDIDDEGEEISVLAPKSDKDRTDQEQYMLDSLRAEGMEDVLKYADILTVSALLAKEALVNGDEKMFEQSNIGILLDKLTNITKNEAADMKRNTPKNRINEMIDSIVQDLQTVSEEIVKYCSGIEKNKRELEERKDWMVEQIRARLNTKILQIVGEAKVEVEQGNRKTISEEELSSKINDAVNETVYKVCVDESVNKNGKAPSIKVKLNGIGEMKMRQESIPYQYVYVQEELRDPHGIFEKVGHKVFKKQYYTHEKREETRFSTFDVGVNDNEIAQSIVLHLGSVFSDTVEAYMETLTKSYYEPVEKMQARTVDEINLTISRLEEMRM